MVLLKKKRQSDASGDGANRKPPKDQADANGDKQLRAKKKNKLRSGWKEEDEVDALEARVVKEAPARRHLVEGSLSQAGGGKDGVPTLTGMKFNQLPISKPTLKGLKEGNFTQMTAVQHGSIPHALVGRDLLGEARTGSGKTLAFLVPMMELLFRRRWSNFDGLGGLIVSPTRELAYQIFQVLKTVGCKHEFSAGCVVGGRALSEEQSLVIGMNILVATPGRLLQHLDESPGFDASGLQMLVLDEADRCLDLGFQETIEHILGHLPSDRQTLLFSATLHGSVHRLGRMALQQPEMVSTHADATSRTPDRLKQVYMVIPLERKMDTLFSFLRSHSQKKLIVFVSACKQVRFLYETFRRLKPGPSILELHGRQSLVKRMVVFQEFSEKENAACLICTDIAARGIDFPEVDWVVQMDCPDTIDTYIHRVGRTARFESAGHAALFLLPSEEPFIAKLKAARINVKSIQAKQGKVGSIQNKLQGLLAEDGAVKHLAQKCFISYIRSVFLMKDKDLFNVESMDREAFAGSLGLVEAPEVKDIGESNADADSNPLKKTKNMTGLQRLKEKIKAKKQLRKGDGDEAKAREEEKDEEAAELAGLEDPKASKKLGKWERRQKRIERHKLETAEKLAELGEGAEDDLLVLASKPGDNTLTKPDAKASTSTSGRKVAFKIKQDGTARGAAGKHVFFGGDEGGVSSQLAQMAAEMQEDDVDAPAGPASSAHDRQAFLKRVAADLSGRNDGDAVVSRARIKDLHQKKRRLDKEERRGGGDSSGDEEGGFTATLGSATLGSACSRSDGSPSPEPQFRGVRGSSAATAVPAEDLGSLEQQALARLSGGGLFA